MAFQLTLPPVAPEHSATFPDQENADPWAPIVLSLDGGGVRGLSSLFILRCVMEKVKELLEQEPNDNPIAKALRGGGENGHPNITAESGPVAAPEVLPCYFFDFMVGTSTGGLIAVMLGRLRMSVDDCIKEYWKLCSDVFRPSHRIRNYDVRKLERAIKNVIMRHCLCHGNGRQCNGENELFQQYDYAEEGEPVNTCSFNRTCKVAVVSQRKGNADTETYLWRTYSHNPRFSENPLEYNPRSLVTARVKIWQVCRATTAAPFYFDKIKINGHHHMDGGVGNNNPSNIAWNEASYMSKKDVALLLSLGTGQSEEQGRFGRCGIRLVAWARRHITETRRAHLSTSNQARKVNAPYFRFTVPFEGTHSDGPGLSKIKISDCEKILTGPRKREKILPKAWRPQRATRPDSPQWYIALQDAAAGKEAGAYKPHKYTYGTYETIFDRTREYCETGSYNNDMEMSRAIEVCAEKLVRFARRRQSDDAERWRCFVSHPNPNHAKHLPPTERSDPE